MMKQSLLATAFAAALSLPTGFALAANQESTPKKAPTQKQIHGENSAKRHERAEHHIKIRTAKAAEEREQIYKKHLAKMRAAKTAEERAQIRKEHLDRMKERAKSVV